MRSVSKFKLIAILFIVRTSFGADFDTLSNFNKMIRSNLHSGQVCSKTPIKKQLSVGPVDCTLMNAAAIRKACLQNTHVAQNAEVFVNGTNRKPCRSYLVVKKKQKISKRYDAKLAGDKIHIEQRVFFEVARTSTPEQIEHFNDRINAILPKIKGFFERQGIDWELKFSTDPKQKKALKPHDTIKLDFSDKRSNSEHWTVEKEIDQDLNWANAAASGGANDFSYLVTHELSHLMGLSDHYEDDGHFCRDTYGKGKINSKRSPEVLCPGELDHGTCHDIMISGIPDESAYSPADYYSLISPFCPNLCTFREAGVIYEWDDYPKVKASAIEELNDLKKQLTKLPKIQITESEEKKIYFEVDKKFSASLKLSTQEIISRVDEVVSQLNRTLPDKPFRREEVMSALSNARDAKDLYRVHEAELVPQLDQIIDEIKAFQGDEIPPRNPLLKKLDAIYAVDFEIRSWKEYVRVMEAWAKVLEAQPNK